MVGSTGAVLVKGGGGSWDVGGKVFQTANTNVTLTSGDAGQTHIFTNNVEIDITLPDATTLGSVGEKFGMYFNGECVNIRLNGGRLLARFDGQSPGGNSMSIGRGMYQPGAKFDCLSIGSAAGTWQLRNQVGTIAAPKLVKETVLSGATKTVANGWQNVPNRHSNSPAVLPRFSYQGSGTPGHNKVMISETQYIQFTRDAVNGTVYRLGLVAADGTTTHSSWAVLSAYTSTSSEFPMVCVLAQNNSGTDTILVDYVSASGARSARFIDITTGTVTVSGTSAAVAWPVTDNNAKALATTHKATNSTVLAGASTTTAYYLSTRDNTTDTVVQNFAWLVTRTGAAGSPVLTFSTPQKICTTNNSDAPTMAVLVGNTANRLAVFASTSGTTAFMNANAATDCGCVLDVSTAATPAASYRLSTANLPTFAWSEANQPRYNTTDQYFYSSSGGADIAKVCPVVKWQVGAAAVANNASVGALVINPDPFGSVTASSLAGGVFAQGSQYYLFPFDSNDIMKGFHQWYYTDFLQYLGSNTAGQYSGPMYTQMAIGIQEKGRFNSKTVTAATVNNLAIANPWPYLHGIVAEITPTNPGAWIDINVGMVVMRDHRYLVATVKRIPNLNGLGTNLDSAEWTFEFPLAA